MTIRCVSTAGTPTTVGLTHFDSVADTLQDKPGTTSSTAAARKCPDADMPTANASQLPSYLIIAAMLGMRYIAMAWT